MQSKRKQTKNIFKYETCPCFHFSLHFVFRAVCFLYPYELFPSPLVQYNTAHCSDFKSGVRSPRVFSTTAATHRSNLKRNCGRALDKRERGISDPRVLLALDSVFRSRIEYRIATRDIGAAAGNRFFESALNDNKVKTTLYGLLWFSMWDVKFMRLRAREKERKTDEDRSLPFVKCDTVFIWYKSVVFEIWTLKYYRGKWDLNTVIRIF